jgi:hypothetical protein
VHQTTKKSNEACVPTTFDQRAVPHRGNWHRSVPVLAAALALMVFELWPHLGNAAGRIIRNDDPGQACDQAYWTAFSGDQFSLLDGGNPSAFKPGTSTIGATLMFCYQYYVVTNSPVYTGYLTPFQVLTSPLQYTSNTSIEASIEPANAASNPFPNSGGDPAQVGLPQNLNYLATNAFMYVWAVPSGSPPPPYGTPAAALIVWTLPDGIGTDSEDYELEFDGWCGTSSATAQFTWAGNIYSAKCSTFTGADLIIDNITGLPDGYVPYPNYSAGVQPGYVDWTIDYATSIAAPAVQAVSTAPISITVQVLKTDNSGVNQGTVVLLDTNGVTQLGSQTVNSSGYATFSVGARSAGSYTFTANYTGVANYSQNSTAPVQVTVAPAAPNLMLTTTSVVLGQTTTLTWTSSGASACTASGAWTGSKAVSGSVTVSATTQPNQTYSLACTGGGVTSTTSNAVLTVTAPPAPTVTVSIAPTSIALGQSATLTWSSTNAASCTADSGWTGSQATAGTLSVTPTNVGGFAYSLTCVGPTGEVGNGAAALVVNAVVPPPGNPPSVIVSVSPASITLGQSATVTWSTTSATSCVADSAWNGSQATSGSLSVTPGTAGGFAYSLTCTGTGGTGNGAAALIVNSPAPAPGPAPTVTISISPTTITLGQSATVTWSSTNATGCTADSAWTGSQLLSGTLSVTPTATGGLAYSLTCSGTGGTANAAAALSVDAAPAATTTTTSSGKSGGGAITWPELLVLGYVCWTVVNGRRNADKAIRQTAWQTH